jgi:hypothetical protein
VVVAQKAAISIPTVTRLDTQLPMETSLVPLLHKGQTAVSVNQTELATPQVAVAVALVVQVVMVLVHILKLAQEGQAALGKVHQYLGLLS